MERFHVVDDAAVILRSNGVFKQAKVYRRGRELYAGYGGGFISIMGNAGTSKPNVSYIGLEVPGTKLVNGDFGRPLMPN